MLNKAKDDLVFTGIGDRFSKLKSFLLAFSPKKVTVTQFRNLSEGKFDGSQREGKRIIIQSNKIDFWTGLDVLLRLRLSVHTGIITEP